MLYYTILPYTILHLRISLSIQSPSYALLLSPSPPSFFIGGNKFHLTNSLKPRVEKKNLYLVQVVSEWVDEWVSEWVDEWVDEWVRDVKEGMEG